MKRILLCVLFAILGLNIQAQTSVNLSWANAMGGMVAGDDNMRRSFTDAAGNIYITGQLANGADMDPSASTFTLYGNYTCYLAKYTAAGNFVWARGLAGSAQSEGKAIGVDGSGNVYLTGTINGGTADMDPTSTNFPLAANGPYDMFISKYNSSGAFQWAQGIGGLSSTVKPECMQVNAAGDIFIGGAISAMSPINFNPTGPSYTLTSNLPVADAYVVKYNNAGLIQWGFTFGDQMSDYVYDLTLDASSNVYICGTYQISVNLDPAAPTTTIAANGAEDGYFAKYTAAGNFVWGKVMGDVLGDGIYRLKLDNNGDLLLSGYMASSSMDADPSATSFILNKVGTGTADIVLGKYSASTGNLIWAKNAGGYDLMHTRAISSDSQNNIYLMGDFNDWADFDLTAASYTLGVTQSSFHDMYLAKYDDTGNLIYVHTIGGAPNTDNFAVGIHVDNSNDIMLAGVHSGSVDVDFNATNNLNTFGGSDFFSVKYSQCIDAGTPTVAVTIQTMCANGVATLSISGGNLNSATNWVWSSIVCGSSTVGVGTTTTVQPLFLTEYFVRGEGGCTNPGPCSSATVDVALSKGITGTVTTGAAIPVPGLVQLFRYEGALTKWDSVTYQNVNASGIYSFNAVNSASYIIMCIPTATDLVKTYAPNNSTWKNATIFSHGCIVDYNINIDVVPIQTLTPGPGILAGKIVEGINYGGKGTSVSPGSPIGGLNIKGGKNPGGIVAQGKTASDGTYTLSGLPVSGPGESYYVFVDIPGVDTSGTHHIAITTGTTSFTDLDFVVDSDYVKPVDYTAIKELNLAGEMVKVYPNPAKDIVYIKMDAKNESNLGIELYDLFGKKVLSEDYNAIQSEFKLGIDVSKLNRGIFFVKVKLNTGEARIKLVLSE